MNEDEGIGSRLEKERMAEEAKHRTTQELEPICEKPSSDMWIYLRFIPVTMLIAALFPLPYDYYTILRIVVCGSLIYLFNRLTGMSVKHDIYVIVLAIFTYLYNPLIPVHLTKEWWIAINLLTIVVLFVCSPPLPKKT